MKEPQRLVPARQFLSARENSAKPVSHGFKEPEDLLSFQEFAVSGVMRRPGRHRHRTSAT